MPECEQDIEAFVAVVGLPTTLIGLAVWVSEIVYGVVMLLLFVGGPNAVGEPDPEFARTMTLLSALFAGLALIPVPAMMLFVRRVMLAQPGSLPQANPSRWAPMARAAQTYPELMRAYGVYIRASLVSTAIGAIPGVFGLILLLLLFPHGSPLNYPIPFALGVALLLAALTFKAFVIPSARGLKDYLREREDAAHEETV